MEEAAELGIQAVEEASRFVVMAQELDQYG